MSVFRVNKTNNYTVLSNYHFRDKTLSLKAKGLLSLMLSLPDTWDYSIQGLVILSSDGETAVRSALKELEEHKYLKRTPIRKNGKISNWEYNIFERPYSDNAELNFPDVENKQVQNHIQLNTKELNTKKINNINLLEFSENKTKPKKNKYQQCIDLIKLFCINNNLNSVVIEDLLKQYLNLLLEIYKEKGKQLFVNQWKGKLNTLQELIKDYDNFNKPLITEDIISQSINCSYQNFYPVNKPNNYNNKVNVDISSKHMTEEDYKTEAKIIEKLKAEGKQWKF